ncbi:MAG: efflux RND transporter periplasmic adaptor subunit [Bacteroidota bacterium]
MKNILQISTLLYIAFFLTSCAEEVKTKKKVLRPVLYQEVGFGDGGSLRTFNGTAQTDKVIGLSFRSGGIITLYNLRIGQKVRKGELLARLDNVQARLAYEQALASLNIAESQEKTAKLSLNRVRSLYEKGSAALSEYESVKNSYQNAINSLESAKRSVAIQKEQINYGYIYAPQTGVIASVSSELGENVNPGQSIAILNAGNKITIQLGIPESVINSVKLGMKVSIDFPVISAKTFEGKVAELSPALDRSTSTYPVEVEVLNPTEEVKSGMAANVNFSFGASEKKTLMIPAKSVGEDSKGRFVFLVKDGGEPATVQKQHIKIGPLHSGGFEVLEGLEAGQKIAVAGLQTLLDGQEVKISQ